VTSDPLHAIEGTPVSAALVTLDALLMPESRLHRYGPLVTVVVPSDVLQTSSKFRSDDLMLISGRGCAGQPGG
jgi:hypothetical protein